MTKLNLLFIDDHPAMIEGYKSILNFDSKIEIFSLQTYDAKSSYELIIKKEYFDFFDVIFLDLSLPSYDEKQILFGEDLIPYCKEHQPKAKIIIITSHTEHFLLYKIFQRTKPDGILIKSDFTPIELQNAFTSIIEGRMYYSATMNLALKKIKEVRNSLDNLDISIIELIAKGIKSKHLTDYLPLTLSAIEKRKAKIKQFLGIEKGTDEDIIRIAKEEHFI